MLDKNKSIYIVFDENGENIFETKDLKEAESKVKNDSYRIHTKEEVETIGWSLKYVALEARILISKILKTYFQ